MVSFGILHSLNSTAVNGDVFIKNLQGGTFAFEHLYLQILDSHIPYEVFCGWYYRSTVEIPSNSIKYAKIWFIDIQVLEFLMVQNYNFPQNSIKYASTSFFSTV
jgi:hypothetical protein